MILLEDNFQVQVLNEATEEGKPKKTYLQGIMSEADSKNRNGRTYAKNELEESVKQINDASKMNRHILGELDHPSSLEVKLENVSHRLVEAQMDGNNVKFKAEVLENHPKGAILKSLIDSDVQVGVSTRGSGTVNESTGKVKDFRFVTLDAVATPSCMSAYPETLQEQLMFSKQGEIVTDLAEAQMHDPLAQKYFQIEMRKFIEQLGKR